MLEFGIDEASMFQLFFSIVVGDANLDERSEKRSGRNPDDKRDEREISWPTEEREEREANGAKAVVWYNIINK